MHSMMIIDNNVNCSSCLTTNILLETSDLLRDYILNILTTKKEITI